MENKDLEVECSIEYCGEYSFTRKTFKTAQEVGAFLEKEFERARRYYGDALTQTDVIDNCIYVEFWTPSNDRWKYEVKVKETENEV